MARDTTSTTVDEYLAALPDARRPAMAAIRSLIGSAHHLKPPTPEVQA